MNDVNPSLKDVAGRDEERDAIPSQGGVASDAVFGEASENGPNYRGVSGFDRRNDQSALS